jgi:hypothetical protein
MERPCFFIHSNFQDLKPDEQKTEEVVDSKTVGQPEGLVRW